jgi:hypothetical protein
MTVIQQYHDNVFIFGLLSFLCNFYFMKEQNYEMKVGNKLISHHAAIAR